MTIVSIVVPCYNPSEVVLRRLHQCARKPFAKLNSFW